MLSPGTARRTDLVFLLGLSLSFHTQTWWMASGSQQTVLCRFVYSLLLCLYYLTYIPIFNLRGMYYFQWGFNNMFRVALVFQCKQKYAEEYTLALEKKGRFQLTIWPDHCIVRDIQI